MREIKFRAWHKTLKIILNVYIISQQKDNNGYTKKCHGWYGENNQIIFAYDQVDWIQYTGLKDKNGKEIYEGDYIVHWWYYAPNKNEDKITNRGIIKFENCEFGFYNGDAWYPLSSFKKPTTIEIIGNIYENSELLKEEE